MISRLKGQLADKSPGQAVIDVQGVGYQVFISLPTYATLPGAGAEIVLDIHTHVREDAIQLYGFGSKREKALFERLTTIAGIGPRLALTILSGSPVDGLIASIRQGDLGRLTAIPGVGKKTAERIVLELKDKLRPFETAAVSDNEADVASALENLGYNRGLIEAAVRRALDGGPDPGFDELFRRALQILTKS